MIRWSFLDTALLVVILFHLIMSPFTKVEESFTIQAVHDILKYGVFDISKYDHHQFPGVVPRSFMGPLVLAMFTKPFLFVSQFVSKGPGSIAGGASGFEAQLLTRAVEGLINGLSLIYLKYAAQGLLDKKKDNEKKSDADQEQPNTIGSWFSVFLFTQFHLMYYSSRTLPNFVGAFALSNVAMAQIMKGNYSTAVSIYAFTSPVFRLELLALCAGIGIFTLKYRKLTFLKLVTAGIKGAALGISLSVFVDSYFWHRWILPEADAFLFNIVSGESVKWGTKPFLAYFTGFLPMLFLPPTVLLLNYLGFKVAPEELKIAGLASYFHIFVMSFQPHKEWRFIVYTVPIITLLGSRSSSYLFESGDPHIVKALATKAILLASPLASLAISGAFLYISSLNYPGGQALMQFNSYVLENGIKNATVYLDVPACMTGATLFGQLNDKFGITYDKTERLSDLYNRWDSFDFIIISHPDLSVLPMVSDPEQWELIQTSQGFSHFNTTYLADVFTTQYSNGFSIVHHLLQEQSFAPLTELVSRTVVNADLLFTYRRLNT
ncbi:LAMI_0G11650g1_1 [Lachancea mirantina]|uniref:Mannosyltransferase n=1 Tax=Lachancea mirantina TaxID=1230905 RepID=A0A1G4KB13_9SACH|nr:LAMI_0G11650g1_1 [Lachancea mirantina]